MRIQQLLAPQPHHHHHHRLSSAPPHPIEHRDEQRHSDTAAVCTNKFTKQKEANRSNYF